MSKRVTVERAMPSRAWLVLMFGALSALGPMSIDMYLPAFPQIAEEMGVEVGQVQLTLSFYMIGLAIGQLMYGTLADRLGRRGPLLVGVLLFCGASLGCALAWSVGSLLVFRIVAALGGSAGMVITRAYVRDRFDAAESAKFYSLNMLVMGLAPIFAPLVGGQLLLLASWRALFGLIVVASACCWVALFRSLPESLPPAKRVRHGVGEIVRTYLGLFRQRVFLSYTLSGACMSGVMFAYVSGSPALFMEEHGVSAQHFGFFFGANAAGLILLSQFNMGLLKRFTARQILVGAYTGSVAAALGLAGVVLSGWGGFWAALSFLWLCIASGGLIYPNATALALAPMGAMAGSASALLGTLQFSLGGICASLVGAFHDGTGRPLVIVMAVVSLAGWLVLKWGARGSRH